MLLHPQRWLIVTVITIAVGVLILILQRPMAGIDFTGGSLLEITSSADAVHLRTQLAQGNYPATVQVTDSTSLLLRLRPLSEDEHQAVLSLLSQIDPDFVELRFESIGPTIGAQLREKALLAVLATIIVMVLYLAYTFRQTAGLIKSWKFGVAAVVALIHDLLVVTVAFALLRQYGATIDTLFVTAMLAILGYSVNDTIVLFDRVREEWLANRTQSLITVLDRAGKATLVRSLNTSITTLLVLGSLLFLGGETLRWFVIALSIGTIAGTYSSLFVAPPVLYWLTRRS